MELRDRLAAHRRRRFVGRATELELFAAALAAAEPEFAVLHLHGPGGVGKSALLAGRQPPTVGWRTDPGWLDLLRVIDLADLASDDATAFLAASR